MPRTAYISFSNPVRRFQPPPPIPIVPPEPQDKRYALLIGINYRGTDSALNGCINDVLAVKKMLMEKFNYEEDHITLMTDDTLVVPTKFRILKAIKNLIEKVNNGECQEFWIHYSGHGSFVIDNDGDEADSHDEVIIPLDYQSAGVITDDKVKQLLNKFSSKSRGIIVFDSCNSGTMADLPYTYDGDYETRKEISDPIGANIVSISGCRDEQLSMDTFENNQWGGAMTRNMLTILEEHDYVIGCFKLIRDLRKILNEKGFQQHPVLSSSRPLKSYQVLCSDISSIMSIRR